MLFIERRGRLNIRIIATATNTKIFAEPPINLSQILKICRSNIHRVYTARIKNVYKKSRVAGSVSSAEIVKI